MSHKGDTQNLSLTVPGWGMDMLCEPGEGQLSIRSPASWRWIAQGSKHLELIRCLGQWSLTVSGSTLVTVKGAGGKARQELVVGILSLSPHLTVQILYTSRVVMQ